LVIKNLNKFLNPFLLISIISMGDKKGLSTIVATLIIILLVLVAAGIIWVIVRNVIQGNAEQIDLGKLTLDLNIEKVSFVENNVSITLKRNAGVGEFVALAFIIEDGENSDSFTEKVSMNELEIRTFIFTLNNTNPDEITKIRIFPIFRLSSGKEITGDAKDTWESNSPISLSQCIPTCPSGAECGNNGCPGGTCGEGCSSGETCVNYACVAACELISATWNETNVLQGTPVQLIVTGTNCAEKTITFEILEYDSWPGVDDAVNTTPSQITFNGTSSYAVWVSAEWQSEGWPESDPPEYYFIAKVSGETESIQSSNRLEVTQPVSCEDGNCNGEETCSTCPSDCGVCPPVCGNSLIEGTEEQCDCGIDGCITSELNGETCTSRLPGYEGTLDCNSSCLFNTSACTPICIPPTCSALGYNCGNWSDTCGGTLICGSYNGGCQTDYTCTNGICVEDCTPTTCSALGYNCGNWSDTCGGTLICGSYNGGCQTDYTCTNGICTLIPSGTQIIADHTVVDRFDDIPEYYMNEVKKMLVYFAGRSHSDSYRTGLQLLEETYPAYAVNLDVGEPYTDQYLRSNYNPSGYVYGDAWYTWFAYPEGSRPSISTWTTSLMQNYSNAGIPFSVIAFGWCWDMVSGYPSVGVDPEYGFRWWGYAVGNPEGDDDLPVGLDAGDYVYTGNSVSMDTYLAVIEYYNNYALTHGMNTKIPYTTGPIDGVSVTGEAAYQGQVKHDYIRNYVKANSSRILFDYADILAYDNNGTQSTQTIDGHTYQIITPTNLGNGETGHIGTVGAIRLAKAQWWMLARIAGWDGISS
jgi:hypothetical protein